MDLRLYAELIASGITYGSIYGILALAMVTIYRANKIFNIALTEKVTFGVIIMYFLLKSFSYPVALLLIVPISFLGGMLIHATVIRLLTEWRHSDRKNTLKYSESVVTIGLFYVFSNLSFYFFGDQPEPFPTPFGDHFFEWNGVVVSGHSLVTVVFSLVLALGVISIFKFTRIGLLLEAVAENISAARLRGIKASNILAFAWGLSLLIGVLAGVLIAPVMFVTPMMLVQIFAYALISVVVGGLESPFGALLGGLIVGVVESLVSNIEWVGTDLGFLGVLTLLLVVLLISPRGLFGRAEIRRV